MRSRIFSSQRQLRDFWLVVFGLALAGLFAADPMAYYLILVPGILPTYFWLKAGEPGMPVLPVVSALSLVYYATPILRGEIPANDDVVLKAAASISAFLLASAAVYLLLLTAASRRAARVVARPLEGRLVVKLAFLGMAGGIVFFVALFSGLLDQFGNLVSIVRAVALAFTVVACYLIGSARASGLLNSFEWAFAIAGLVAIFNLSVSGLFLVGGVMNMLAFMLGYVVTARRIPWFAAIVIFLVISVLQAGKLDIRRKYWFHSQSVTGSVSIPGRLVDWFEEGVASLISGRSQVDVLQRASLFQMVVAVQETTPSVLPYLEGETYAMLPAMLVPRFINHSKPNSQAVLNLLGVRYGFQNQRSTVSTTIGWGLVAEAWANDGFWAVLAVGFVFGGLCGIVTWVSSGAPVTSLRMLSAIVVTAVLLDIEADLSYLLVTIFQSVIAVIIAGPLAIGVIKLFTASPAVRATDLAAPDPALR